MSIPLSRAAVCVVAVAATLTGCGGGSDNHSTGGGDNHSTDDPQQVVDLWADITCGTSPVRQFTGPELSSLQFAGAGDIELRGVCDNADIAGTWEAKLQSMTIFKSEAGLQTHLATKDCASGRLLIKGDGWLAVTRVPEYATKLAESGGELACQSGS